MPIAAQIILATNHRRAFIELYPAAMDRRLPSRRFTEFLCIPHTRQTHRSRRS